MPSEKREAICHTCHVGRMERGRVSFLKWLNGKLIVIPDFPAWICDICGSYEYETGALIELQAMLSLNQTERRTSASAHPDLSASQGSTE
jgi:YgiT-type zinc finger domain-containing protein